MRWVSCCVVFLLAGCADDSAPSQAVDFDQDGIRDRDEIEAGLDPAVADSDGDGLDDGDELDAGTNPLVRDTDGGGTNDGDEVAQGFDPLDPSDDGPNDPDGDGANNTAERLQGTDPLNWDTDEDCIPDGFDDEALVPQPPLELMEERSEVEVEELTDTTTLGTYAASQTRSEQGPLPCQFFGSVDLALAGDVRVEPWNQSGWRFEMELLVENLDGYDVQSGEADLVVESVRLHPPGSAVVDGELALHSAANLPPRTPPRSFAPFYTLTTTVMLPAWLELATVAVSPVADDANWMDGDVVLEGLAGHRLTALGVGFASEFRGVGLTFATAEVRDYERATLHGSFRDVMMADIDDRIDAEVIPWHAARVNLTTTSFIGDGIDLRVPTRVPYAGGYAYNIDAETEDGQVRIDLPALVWLGASEGSSAQAQTAGFEDAEFATEILLRVRDGDVHVTGVEALVPD